MTKVRRGGAAFGWSSSITFYLIIVRACFVQNSNDSVNKELLYTGSPNVV